MNKRWLMCVHSTLGRNLWSTHRTRNPQHARMSTVKIVLITKIESRQRRRKTSIESREAKVKANNSEKFNLSSFILPRVTAPLTHEHVYKSKMMEWTKGPNSLQLTKNYTLFSSRDITFVQQQKKLKAAEKIKFFEKTFYSTETESRVMTGFI